MNHLNRTALITGASSGIGKAFAQHLAGDGYDLILVARRLDRLEKLKQELQKRYSISVKSVSADLTTDQGIALVEGILAAEVDLHLLINNAGLGVTEEFANCAIEKQMAMIQVHVIAPVRLARAALPGLIKQGEGGIINVASVAAFLPGKRNVTYSATKGYLVIFSESLQAELNGTGVYVQVLCPGFTRTEFHDTAELQGFNRSHIPGFLWMTPEQVVRASLSSFRRNSVVCVPGFAYQVISALARFPVTGSLIRKVMNARG